MPVTATLAGNPPTCTDAPLEPGEKLPAPLPVSCLNQHILVSRTPTEPVSGRPVLTRTHAVEIPGQQKATIRHIMRDPNGVPVDLSQCLCAAESSESSISDESAAACACPYKMVFRLSEYLSGPGGTDYPVALVTDGADGAVQVELTPEDTTCPGVYFGQFALIECSEDPDAEPTGDTTVLFSNHMYVIVGRNLWNNRMNVAGPAGPPSLAEVRMHLRDTDPSESFLLDNLAFSDEEIAHATILPVQYWNEIPPPIGTFTTTSFPFRYHWLMGIAGYLFLSAAEQQRRNNLQYSAGGVQIDDQHREPNYEQAAQRRLEEFKQFVKRKKAEINLEGAYGGIGSTYGTGRW